MQFSSKTTTRIGQLRIEISSLERELETEKESFIAGKVGEGWKKFLFFSSYYGSHWEYGEGDEERTFVFHPSVDISRWESAHFAHGHNGQNEENDAWEAWLESLADDQYIEI